MTINQSNKNDVLLLTHRGQVDTILKDQGNVQSKVHSFIVAFCKDVINNNCSLVPLSELFNGLGKGVNKTAIKEWIYAFTPLRWNEDSESFKRSKAHKWSIDQVLQGSHQPYYVFEKTKKTVNRKFDSGKRIASLVKALTKTIEEFHSNNVDAESLETILATLKLLEE